MSFCELVHSWGCEFAPRDNVRLPAPGAGCAERYDQSSQDDTIGFDLDMKPSLGTPLRLSFQVG